jgi:hypothetical protein
MNLWNILFAQKHGASPTGDFFEELLAGYTKPSEVKTLTGIPPLTFASDGSNLKNWAIFGNDPGVGEQTKNLLDISNVNSSTNGINVKEEDGSLHIYGKSNRDSAFFVNLITPDKPTAADTNFSLKAGTYTLSGMVATTNSIVRLQILDETETETTLGLDDGSGLTFTLDSDSTVRVRLNFRRAAYDVPVDITIKPMLRPADTSADFEPYGYKMPVTCGGVTTNIFTQSQLMDGDVLTLADTGVNIPTTDGNNTLTVGTTVQPSSMTIVYNGK